MSLTDLFGGAIKQQLVAMVAQKLGVNQQTATTAVNFALPLLLNGLSKNTETPEGAEALHQAVSKDHDGGILQDLGGFIQHSEQGPGAGILSHILGANQAPAQEAVSQSSGLDANQTAQLMQILAPVLLGSLGAQAKSEGLDSAAMAGMVREKTQAEQQAQSPDLMSALSSLFSNGAAKEGNVMNDLGGMLGGLLGGK